jgi:hypothetical protein
MEGNMAVKGYYKLTLTTNDGEVLERFQIANHAPYRETDEVYDLRGTLAGQMLITEIRDAIARHEKRQ